MAGRYRPHFNACNHSLFVGFYKEDYAETPCDTDKHLDLQGKQFCKKGWLPESAYAEIVKNIMIFANGYRSIERLVDITRLSEFNESSDLIETSDIRGYWSGQDGSFKSRRKPDIAFYADGHHSITTSNHNVDDSPALSTAGFMFSLNSSLDALVPTHAGSQGVPVPNQCYQNAACVKLDQVSNVAGFNYRRVKGKRAGEQLVTRLLAYKKNGTKMIYNIDVVAHSMGFAYAQGMIEALKASGLDITWDGYYVIAPENGIAGDIGSLPFKEIWQYGSDLQQAGADPMWQQDGVAPQSAVGGINNLPSGNTKGGRAFIPKTFTPKGFVESHSISNYGWIFKILTPDDKGYVTPK